MNTTKRRGPQRKLNAMHIAKLTRLLWDGTRTLAQLTEETGLHYLTVQEYCREMHTEDAVHIVGWSPDSRGRHVHRIYMLGPGRDAKRPVQTPAQRMAKQRAKRKAREQMAVLAGLGRYEVGGNNRVRFVPEPA